MLKMLISKNELNFVSTKNTTNVLNFEIREVVQFLPVNTKTVFSYIDKQPFLSLVGYHVGKDQKRYSII